MRMIVIGMDSTMLVRQSLEHHRIIRTPMVMGSRTVSKLILDLIHWKEAKKILIRTTMAFLIGLRPSSILREVRNGLIPLNTSTLMVMECPMIGKKSTGLILMIHVMV